MAPTPSAPPQDIAPETPPLDAAALTACLRAGGSLPAGRVAGVEVVRRFRANASGLFRLALRYTGRAQAAAPGTVVCKVYTGDWYERNGVDEARFYSQLAPGMDDAPAPALLGVVHAPAERRCVLLLEDLEARYSLAAEPLRRGRLGRAVDELARLHAHWWQHPRLRAADLAVPQNGLSRLAQALPAAAIRGNARQAQKAIAPFADRFAAELGEDALQLLQRLPAAWGERFAARVADGRGLTLCHGDVHLFGNVFFPREAAAGARPRFVDWNQHRRGVGAHDLAYCLLCHDVDPAVRLARDTALLRRYHRDLRRGGVTGYTAGECEWDFRFSLLTNLFLAFFAGRLAWFTRTMAAVRVWDAARTLEE